MYNGLQLKRIGFESWKQLADTIRDAEDDDTITLDVRPSGFPKEATVGGEYIYAGLTLPVLDVADDGRGGIDYELSLIGTPFVESHGHEYTIVNEKHLIFN